MGKKYLEIYGRKDIYLKYYKYLKSINGFRDRLTKLNNGHLPVWGEMMAGGIGGASQVSREHWRSIARKAKNSHG